MSAVLLALFLATCLAILLGAPRFIPTALLERHARQRSAARAAEVAAALGFRAERDGEIPTTFHLRGHQGEREIEISMGSPLLAASLFRRGAVDWISLRAPGPPEIPPGVEVRPPRRTVFEWRDGSPGEAPTRVTPRGVALVVEPAGSVVDEEAIDAWVDRMPEGVWLCTARREAIELRARAPATEPAPEAVRRLIQLSRSVHA